MVTEKLCGWMDGWIGWIGWMDEYEEVKEYLVEVRDR